MWVQETRCHPTHPDIKKLLARWCSLRALSYRLSSEPWCARLACVRRVCCDGPRRRVMTLGEEMGRIHKWITERGSVGQTCDECGSAFAERGKIAVTQIIYGHHDVSDLWPLRNDGHSQHQEGRLLITERLVSERAAEIILCTPLPSTVASLR